MLNEKPSKTIKTISIRSKSSNEVILSNDSLLRETFIYKIIFPHFSSQVFLFIVVIGIFKLNMQYTQWNFMIKLILCYELKKFFR